MNKNIIAGLAALAFGLAASASTTNVYFNNGTITNPPVIDAVAFVNAGTFEAVTAFVGGDNLDTAAPTPYATHDTLYYTNLFPGVMIGQPGFLFEDLTDTGTKESGSFNNTGTILAVDTQTPPEPINNGGTYVIIPGTGVPYASEVLIAATNVFNGPNGNITVGAEGLLQMTGQNVTNNKSDLIAGDLTGNDPYDVTAQAQESFIGLEPNSTTVFAEVFTAPTTLFDLWWGTANVTGAPYLLDLGAVANGEVPPVDAADGNLTVRGGEAGTNFIVNYTGYAISVYSYAVSQTNIYYNIVCVNTNFSSPNITDQVMFSPRFEGYFENVTVVNPKIVDGNGAEAIVQFSEPATDVITGLPATSSIYLLDGGALFSNSVVTLTNLNWLNGYARPAYFEVSTATPNTWLSAVPANDPKDAANLSSLISGAGAYGDYVQSSSSPVGEAFTAATYGVQVGVDPEILNGVFPLTTEINTVADIPDPTAEPARIDIEGGQVDLTGARIRAEGLVTLVATNLTSGAPGAVDWGMINASIGATNGALVISNRFPQSFTRLRGDLFAWSANWYLLQTNAAVTNNLAFHLLVVDQDLQGSYHPTVRSLTLTGQKSVDVEDPLTVVGQDVFETTNLTINSAVHLTQNASSFGDTNVPLVKQFVVNTNGILTVDNVLDLGLDPAQNQISPVGRQYAISAIGNFGQIVASSPSFQSAVFENDGTITTSNGGSMTIEAETLDMGLVLTNQANSMLVNGNLVLSAAFMGFTNSSISTGTAGGAFIGSGGSLTLETTTGGQITDFTPGIPGAGGTMNNFWQVTAGFNLPVKPATGDLFGTEIETIATNTTVAQHVWAGRGDYTNIVDGFMNNVVIGHLKLSRQSEQAELHFTGAGTNNGMYVDYLELDPNSFSGSPTEYKNGLVIDPNLTIYFAACNVDPLKVQSIAPGRLVWVTNFFGPNSSVLVTNELDMSQYCPVNASVADSLDPAVSFFPGTLNGENPNKPYVANDPVTKAWLFTNGCPMVMITPENPTGPTGSTTNFALVKGVYNGLFYDTNGVSSTNSGFFTLTLAQSGTFTGRLLMGPATYSFSGTGTNKFSSANSATVTAKSGRLSLTVALNLEQVDTPNGTIDQVQGTVSSTNWTAQLLGDLKPVWTTKNPSPYAGQYTMILTNGGSNSVPIGDSYGTLTVSPLGVVSVAGQLADGNAFSQSVPVSAAGMWPFYTYVAGGKDFLLGWIAFQNSDSGWLAFQKNSDSTAISIGQTNIFWSKAPYVRDRIYTGGFTNFFDEVSSPYTVPGKGSPVLSLTSPEVILSGGGLLTTTNAVVYNAKTSTYSGNGLTLTLSPKVGSFTGRLQPPGAPAIKLGGVVLQNQDAAFGYFFGIDAETGAVLLQGQ